MTESGKRKFMRWKIELHTLDYLLKMKIRVEDQENFLPISFQLNWFDHKDLGNGF